MSCYGYVTCSLWSKEYVENIFGPIACIKMIFWRKTREDDSFCNLIFTPKEFVDTRWQLVNVRKLKCYFLSKLWSKTLRRWCVWKEIICSFDFCKLRTLTSTSRASTSILAFFGSAHFKFLILSQIFATFWERGYSTAYKKQGKKLFFQIFNFFLQKCSFSALICRIIWCITIISHEDI